MRKPEIGFLDYNVSTRRQVLLAAALAAGGLGAAKSAAAPENSTPGAAAGAGISHRAASIHQEPVFPASRKRLYEALTDAEQFDQVVQLSGAMQGLKSKVPTAIDAAPGGAFSLFGGYVSGRQIELAPDQLIVQAWRAGSWGAGLYSIVRFALVENGGGSKIIFDHVGFPNDQAEHLAAGWQANYWMPLAKLLSP
jgi:activator of HSP90 ATPase